jgi:uncharacterized alkaline shock family protein YloU
MSESTAPGSESTATGSQQQSSSPPTSGGSEGRPRSSSVTPRRAELATEQGKTSIADSVVAKIAGLACREIDGVHEMGAGLSRTLGVLKERLPVGSSQPSASRGVNVEVGERQAAVDLDIVVEYGASIVDLANAVRQNVIGRVEAMTGLEVTEVNITVDDVYVGDEQEPSEPRVQ